MEGAPAADLLKAEDAEAEAEAADGPRRARALGRIGDPVPRRFESIGAPNGDRERAAHVAHFRRAQLPDPPGQPGLLDGLHMIEVDG